MHPVNWQVFGLHLAVGSRKVSKRSIRNGCVSVVVVWENLFYKIFAYTANVFFFIYNLPKNYMDHLKPLKLHVIVVGTDYRHPVRKSPSLHGRKSTSVSKFLGVAKAYFFCQIGANFQISLIYAFIGFP